MQKFKRKRLKFLN